MSAGDWKELYSAATNGDMSLVQYHLKQGVDPNYQHPEILATPLVAAILNGHTQVAIYLIEHGASPTLESYFDNLTPLAAAKKIKNPVLIQFLLHCTKAKK